MKLRGGIVIKACKVVKDNIKETVSADKKSTFEINELIDDYITY